MAKVTTFARRLRELLDLRGMTQAELSRRSGISTSSVSHYLKGDWEGKPDVVFSLAERCDVSETWLMGYDVPMERSAPPRDSAQSARLRAFEELPEEAQERALEAGQTVPLSRLEPGVAREALRLHRTYCNADEHTRQLVDLALRPFRVSDAFGEALAAAREADEDGFEELDIYEEAAAAGFGNYLDLPCARRERYPAGYIPARADFGVRISGSSMEPRIHDESTVFVQSASAIGHGEVGIFVLNGLAYCKQLLLDPEGHGARLHSFNAAYSDIPLGEADELRTLGRVLGSYPP